MAKKPLVPDNLEDIKPPSYVKSSARGKPGRRLPDSNFHTDEEESTDPGEVVIPVSTITTEPDLVSAEMIRRASSLLAELTSRASESLGLYNPLPLIDLFHRSTAQIRLLRGSNRSGKTLGAACEIARAVTGQDPHGKWPTKDGRFFLIGKDGKHLGDVMFRKLFKPRAFLIIRDKVSGDWRSWRPYDPEDLERINETKPAPALIPRRFVRDIAWENKKASIPTMVKLVNGWELNFFSSLAKPPQGSDIDGCWFDEEIVDPEWVPEMQARILDRNGRIVWSFTPQAGTEHAFDLHERAEDEKSDPDRQVEEFVALLTDNSFMSEKAKRDFERNISNEDERLVRIGGEFAVSGFKVYPEYGDRHLVDYFDIPQDWCLYAFVDPGRQRCAVAFVAIPPDGRCRYFYDELYIKDCDARKFGKAFADKARQRTFQAFYIDGQEGRKREAGSGRSIMEQYAAALKEHNVASIESGSSFIVAPSDVKSGIEAVRSWMVEDQHGEIKLRVMRSKCPNMDKELRRYHYKRVAGIVTDEPVKKNDHLADTLRYAAASEPKYRKPKRVSKTISGILKYLAAKRARRNKGKQGSRVNLGPQNGKGQAS